MTSQRRPPGVGICSVTYRQLTARRLAEQAARAGLAVIEWGADVHAPPSEPAVLSDVAAATEQYGLRCHSYGSYFRAGVSPASDLVAIARAANVLGATRIRVWAGAVGTADASASDRDRVVRGLRHAVEVADHYGLEVATEFHSGTLADSAEAVLRLIEAVDRPGLGSYWQPPVGMPDDEALQGLAFMADHVVALHVFSWWPEQERRPLMERGGLWRGAADVLTQRKRDIDWLLEFVPDDDPGALAGEARSLLSLRPASSSSEAGDQ
ncbi:MAG: TIM barrel protein [Terracoccus sp.]